MMVRVSRPGNELLRFLKLAFNYGFNLVHSATKDIFKPVSMRFFARSSWFLIYFVFNRLDLIQVAFDSFNKLGNSQIVIIHSFSLSGIS